MGALGRCALALVGFYWVSSNFVWLEQKGWEDEAKEEGSGHINFRGWGGQAGEDRGNPKEHFSCCPGSKQAISRWGETGYMVAEGSCRRQLVEHILKQIYAFPHSHAHIFIPKYKLNIFPAKTKCLQKGLCTLFTGEQHIGIPFLQELHVCLGMQSSWLCQTHTIVFSSECLAPIQALLTGNLMAVTLFTWLQDNVSWGYVFILEIHKTVPTQDMAWKRLQKPTGAWRMVEVRSQNKLGRTATVPGTRWK